MNLSFVKAKNKRGCHDLIRQPPINYLIIIILIQLFEKQL